jgi:hypothetical protein
MPDMEDEIRRIVNEHRKKELSEEFGATFSPSDADFSVETEFEWLGYIEEYERQFESATEIPVREYVGFPEVRPLDEIPPEELTDELDRIMEILYENCVVVDYIHDVTVIEAYRFVTEELLDVMMGNIRIPDMFTHFIYEEFHPNDVEDIKEAGTEFVRGFLVGRSKALWEHLVDGGVLDLSGQLLDCERLKQLMDNFQINHNPVAPFAIEPLTTTVEGDEGAAVFHVTWHKVDPHTEDLAKLSASVALHFRRCPYGGWDLVEATVPFD